jgi:hypothetical protein
VDWNIPCWNWGLFNLFDFFLLIDIYRVFWFSLPLVIMPVGPIGCCLSNQVEFLKPWSKYCRRLNFRWWIVLGWSLLLYSIELLMTLWFLCVCVCVQNAFEEGGVLYEKKVYLFGCTERKYICFHHFVRWLGN